MVNKSVILKIISSYLMLQLSSFLYAQDFPATTIDGMMLVEGSKVDAAYKKPDADFSTYDSFMIDIVEVRFKKNWEKDMRNSGGSRTGISQRDKERIVRDFSDLMYSTFSEVLQEDDTYLVVNQPGENVLGVRVFVNDLYISAPDRRDASRSTSFVSNAGSMVLIGELYDSESGEVLARFADGKAARDEPFMTWSSSAYNRQEGRRMFRAWAEILKDAMDEVHGLN